MKKGPLVILLSLAILAIGYLIYSRKDMIGVQAAPGADLAVIIDNSTSQSIDCGEIATLVASGLNDLDIGKSSHLLAYTLGSSENRFEPKPQLDLQLGRGSGGKRKAIRQIEKACSSFGTVESSSIFRAVEVALDQLQTRGLTGSKLILSSDLEENVDPRLPRKHTKKTALLHNAGIQTLFCGVAVTNEGGGPRGQRADALVKTWREAFAAPENLKIEPFCPGQRSVASR